MRGIFFGCCASAETQSAITTSTTKNRLSHIALSTKERDKYGLETTAVYIKGNESSTFGAGIRLRGGCEEEFVEAEIIPGPQEDSLCWFILLNHTDCAPP